jgi:hypothetical protein
MTITAVTRLIHVAWVTVGRIIARVVDRKLDRARLEARHTIGLDEVSYRKGPEVPEHRLEPCDRDAGLYRQGPLARDGRPVLR